MSAALRQEIMADNCITLKRQQSIQDTHANALCTATAELDIVYSFLRQGYLMKCLLGLGMVQYFI